MNKNEQEFNIKKETEKPEEKVKALLKRKKAAAALGLAVLFTVSCAFTGCSQRDDEDDDDSYYTSNPGGGSYIHTNYFYTKGSSYKQGTWSKSTSSNIGSGYSSSRGGSIGG